MHHLIMAVALLVFTGLDVVFVQFSDTPAAALIFAVLAYLILLILSGAAGGFAQETGTDNGLPSPPGATAQSGMSARVIAAALIPVSLLLILAYIPELGDPLDPSATVQLGSTFAVFWLLMSLALVGAVLGFIYPRTGALEAVLVGGTVVVAQSLLSWIRVDASREAVQLALYSWMVWVSVSLIGAWVGISLRQLGTSRLFGAQGASTEPPRI